MKTEYSWAIYPKNRQNHIRSTLKSQKAITFTTNIDHKYIRQAERIFEKSSEI